MGESKRSELVKEDEKNQSTYQMKGFREWRSSPPLSMHLLKYLLLGFTLTPLLAQLDPLSLSHDAIVYS